MAWAKYNYIPVLGLFPARIKEISNPRLKAWLNIRRVWNVDTNGNHEKNAMGTKMSIPMPASYRRASDRMNFHSPSLFITGFHAAAIDKIPHPVGMNAKIEANTSGTDRSVNIIATTKPASANKRDNPCTNRNTSWKLTDIFWLKVNTLKRIISTANTTHDNP